MFVHVTVAADAPRFGRNISGKDEEHRLRRVKLALIPAFSPGRRYSVRTLAVRSAIPLLPSVPRPTYKLDGEQQVSECLAFSPRRRYGVVCSKHMGYRNSQAHGLQFWDALEKDLCNE